MINLDILQNNIGKKYDEITMGCVNPVYLLFPDIPVYEFKIDEKYFLPLVKKHFDEIKDETLEDGDLLILKVSDDWHFGIFKKPNLIYHCTEKSKLRLSRLDFYKKYIVKKFRYKKGVI